MKFEARIAAGLGVPVVCGGDGKNLSSLLTHAMAAGCGGLISFGVAGGLAPHLKPGTCVIGSEIIHDEGTRATDARWAQRLTRLIPGSVYGAIAGVRQPIAHAADKRRLHGETGAIAVDMESHIAARIAAAHALPFAACRVIIDPAERTLPPAALVGMRADGRADVLAVLASLLRQPRQLFALMRVVADARAARSALFQGRRSLGADLSFPHLRGLQLNPSL